MNQNTDQIVALAASHIAVQNAVLDPLYEKLCQLIHADYPLTSLDNIEGWVCDLINCTTDEEINKTLTRMRNVCGRLNKNTKKNIIIDNGVPYAQGSGRIGKQYLQEKFRKLSENTGKPNPNTIGPANSNAKVEYLDNAVEIEI